MRNSLPLVSLTVNVRTTIHLSKQGNESIIQTNAAHADNPQSAEEKRKKAQERAFVDEILAQQMAQIDANIARLEADLDALIAEYEANQALIDQLNTELEALHETMPQDEVPIAYENFTKQKEVLEEKNANIAVQIQETTAQLNQEYRKKKAMLDQAESRNPAILDQLNLLHEQPPEIITQKLQEIQEKNPHLEIERDLTKSAEENLKDVTKTVEENGVRIQAEQVKTEEDHHKFIAYIKKTHLDYEPDTSLSQNIMSSIDEILFFEEEPSQNSNLITPPATVPFSDNTY